MDAYDVIACAERMFQRSGCTQFPTVHRLARACRCKQKEIEQICEDTGLACLQGYNIEDWKLGDLEVYVFDGEFSAPNTQIDRR